MRKLFLIMIISSAFLVAGDVLQKTFNIEWNEDASKRLCQMTFDYTPITCDDDDLECQVLQNICDFAIKLPVGTIDDEAFKASIRLGSIVVHGMINFAIKKKLLKASQLGDFWLVLYGAVNNKALQNTGFGKLTDKGALGEFFLSIAYDAIVTVGINSLTHNALESIRSNSVSTILIHDSASDEALKKAFIWMLTLAKNDFRTYLAYKNLDIVTMVDAGVIDNLVLLGDISINVTNSYVDFINANTATTLSNIRGEMLDLYIGANKNYSKLDSVSEKEIVLNNFLSECDSKNLSWFGLYTALPVANGSFIFEINAMYKLKCQEYKEEIIAFDAHKFDILNAYMIKNDEMSFNRYIENYFPDSEQYNLKQLFEISNFDFGLKVSKNLHMRKYLRQFMSYGFTIDDISELLSESTLITPDYHMKEYMTNNLVWSAYVGLHPYSGSVPFAWLDKDVDNIQNMTRIEFARFLVETFNLTKPKPMFMLVENASFNNLELPYAHILKSLGIVKSDNTIEFRPNDNITSFEALVMTVNTMDYKKCGHVGCEISEILGVQQ